MTDEAGDRDTRSGAARLWKRLFATSLVLSAVVAATLAPHLRDSAELVRMRNALLLQSEPAVSEWTPAAVPAGFAVESAPPVALYADTVERHALRVEGDDWATALRIGRHLLPAGAQRGRAIQSGLEDTYRRIVRGGEGYCGDFADSFTGLANVSGVFSRPWAFSFDGFGGHGHIFNEIWDRGSARWIMIDVFNNFYVTDAAGRALSAMEFRKMLQDGAQLPRLVPVNPAAPPGFRFDEKAIDYYRRGLPEWYMWWGNNVFEYDRAPLVRVLGGTHRALEQLGGIAAGVHPAIRIVEMPENEAQRGAMRWLRLRLLAAVVLGGASLVSLLGWLWSRRRGGGRRA